MPLIYRRLIFCLFNSGREKERVLIQCQLRCCLCVLLSGDFMSPVRNSLCLGELGGLTFGHCFSKSSIMSAATCIREMRDFAILWAILGCILGLCACGQSFHCLFLQEKKRERYPCWLYPFLKEKERERAAIHAGFILSCKSKRGAIHAGFILLVQRGRICFLLLALLLLSRV